MEDERLAKYSDYERFKKKTIAAYAHLPDKYATRLRSYNSEGKDFELRTTLTHFNNDSAASLADPPKKPVKGKET